MLERTSDRWVSITLSVLLHGTLVAALVYVMASLAYEAIGHVGAGLLFGVRPALIISTHVVFVINSVVVW